MTKELLTLEVTDRVATLTLKNPPSNLLSRQVVMELENILTRVESDHAIKVVLLTSSGRFFCPGADIRELEHILDAQQGKDNSARGQDLMSRLDRLNKPIIAVIQGACLGGGLELALACHLRLAAKGASFGLPELNLGLIPGYGGTQRLPRIIGLSKATEFLLTGAVISADDAHRIGLVNEVLPDSELLPRAQGLANLMRDKSGPAVQAVLEILRIGRDRSFEEGLSGEAEHFGKLCETRDAKEGIRAFLEKRDPTFRDE